MPTSRDTDGKMRGVEQVPRLLSQPGNPDGRSTPRIPRHPARSGFTLVELLVSMAILILLVAILSNIFSSVSKTSQLGYSNNERIQNILAITDFIRTDLRAALLPINRPDTNNLQFIVNPGSISANFKNPHSVFWQSPTAANQTLGDVAEVGYFVRWNLDNPANPRPFLCRFEKDISNGNPPDAIDGFRVYQHPTDWINDDVIAAVAPADKANAYHGLIAENVVALFVQCLDATGQPITKTSANAAFNNAVVFDSRQGFTDSTGKSTAACALPPVVRLGFVLIDTRSVARIGAAEKTALGALSATDAADYVTKALASPQLKAISQGLRPYQIEIGLLNAR